jgi:type VI protein secretion system component VasF
LVPSWQNISNRHPILDRFVPAILIAGGALIGLYACYSYWLGG